MHAASVPSTGARALRVPLDGPPGDERWVLREEDMPESNPHRDAVRLLELLLLAFVARTGRNALVAGNLACRWEEERPQIGVDPDVALVEPAPPEGARTQSLRTWLPGHVPPRFAIEVVSASNPNKDYEQAPTKYGVLGTRELVIFDPERLGPSSNGGPFVLQVWRHESAAMVRVYAGDGPAWSEELDAWLVVTGDGHLRFADDEQGTRLWPTDTERAEAALRAAVQDLCDVLGVTLDDARRAHIASLDAAGLDALRVSLKTARAWPD